MASGVKKVLFWGSFFLCVGGIFCLAAVVRIFQHCGLLRQAPAGEAPNAVRSPRMGAPWGDGSFPPGPRTASSEG